MLKRVEVTFWGCNEASQTKMLRLLLGIFMQDLDIHDQGGTYCELYITLYSRDAPVEIFAQAYEALGQLRVHAPQAGMSIKFTTEEQ
jgi:hypothetical protein